MKWKGWTESWKMSNSISKENHCEIHKWRQNCSSSPSLQRDPQKTPLPVRLEHQWSWMEILLNVWTSDAIFEHGPGVIGDFLVCKDELLAASSTPGLPRIMWGCGRTDSVLVRKCLNYCPTRAFPLLVLYKKCVLTGRKTLNRQGNKNHP